MVHVPSKCAQPIKMRPHQSMLPCLIRILKQKPFIFSHPLSFASGLRPLRDQLFSLRDTKVFYCQSLVVQPFNPYSIVTCCYHIQGLALRIVKHSFYHNKQTQLLSRLRHLRVSYQKPVVYSLLRCALLHPPGFVNQLALLHVGSPLSAGLDTQLSRSTHAFVWTLSLSNVLYDFTIRLRALSLT